MPIQQAKPIMIGFPPVLTSFTILVFKPIAAMAMTMKNLDMVLKGAKKLTSTPKLMLTVVIRLANTKSKMKKGNTDFMFTFLPSPFSFRARCIDKAKVIGIIASVLVSFTVMALSRV